jgi:isopentenyl-diphosphate delta-isomerase
MAGTDPAGDGDRLARVAREHWPAQAMMFQALLDAEPSPSADVLKAAAYQVLAGGKRIRAALPLLVATALAPEPDGRPASGIVRRARWAGLAAEQLHCATLSHDDVMDGDALRRGQPTAWVAFGMPQAINAGDLLFFLGEEAILRMGMDVDTTGVLLAEYRSTIRAMVHGQALEFALRRDHVVPSMDEYEAIARGKTGAMFSLCLVLGWGAARRPSLDVGALRAAGRDFGLLFQVCDDILDIYGDKGRGQWASDLWEGKPSWLVANAARSLDAADMEVLRETLFRPREAKTDDDIAALYALIGGPDTFAMAVAEMKAIGESVLDSAGRQFPQLLGPLAALIERTGQVLIGAAAPPPPAPSVPSTAARKDEHLNLALSKDVEMGKERRGFDAVRLIHQALPELDMGEVDTSATFLGKALRLPLLIGSMTGGTPRARQINRILATAAQETGVGMCLGSQRAMLEVPELVETYRVRDVAHDVLLIANLGAVQLRRHVSPEMLCGAVAAVGADALVLHLNAAQEAVQPEGDTDFRGVADAIRAAAAAVPVPSGVKEVGSGFSVATVQRLAGLGLAFLESAGVGGTSWPLVESMRARSDTVRQVGETFAGWGIDTVESLSNCVEHGGGLPVVASGGVRTGLDIAKAIALGAQAGAMALPFLRAADEGVAAVVELIDRVHRELVTAMFLTGYRTLDELRGSHLSQQARAQEPR